MGGEWFPFQSRGGGGGGGGCTASLSIKLSQSFPRRFTFLCAPPPCYLAGVSTLFFVIWWWHIFMDFTQGVFLFYSKNPLAGDTKHLCFSLGGTVVCDNPVCHCGQNSQNVCVILFPKKVMIYIIME